MPMMVVLINKLYSKSAKIKAANKGPEAKPSLEAKPPNMAMAPTLSNSEHMPNR